MTGTHVGLIAAFLAGLVSFVSPCVLPLVPGYLSFLAGDPLRGGAVDVPRRGRLLLQATLFVVGFSLVFIALGASASALGSVLRDYRDLLSRAAGVLVFAFGFLLLGVVKSPWLYRELRLDPARGGGHGSWTGLAVGVLFGLGWTPCVGPILGAILVLAGSSASLSLGVLLLAAYSAGLAVPFLAAAVLLDRTAGVSGWLARHSVVTQRISGVVLMALGLAMASGTLGATVAALSRLFRIPALG